MLTERHESADPTPATVLPVTLLALDCPGVEARVCSLQRVPPVGRKAP